MPNSDGYIVGYILQVGNTLVKQHITSQNLNYNLETCKKVNTTKFLNQKMKKNITPGKLMAGDRSLRIEKHT